MYTLKTGSKCRHSDWRFLIFNFLFNLIEQTYKYILQSASADKLEDKPKINFKRNYQIINNHVLSHRCSGRVYKL